MANKIITIDLEKEKERDYDIYIGGGLLARINDFVPENVSGRNLFIITDRNVEPYASRIEETLREEGAKDIANLVLEPGEKTKSITEYDRICQWLLENGVNRGALIFAVGGGVVGDITGFAAATVLRGIDFVQVPTTLLAQVDSSVGGKTGINTPQGKNLIGAFHQPIGVVSDIEVLKTLPKRELLAGYAEMAKHGLINDAAFFRWLEDNGQSVLEFDAEDMAYAIERACRIKANVVQADEKEQGARALLNLGHTFGHALETAAKYDGRLLHGEGVAIGTVMAFDLSVRMDLCPADDLQSVEEHFAAMGLPTQASHIRPSLNASVDELMDIMQKDKKVKDGRMTFILTNGIGEAFISQDVDPDLVRAVLKDSLGGESGKPTSPKQSANYNFMGGIKERWKTAFSSQ